MNESESKLISNFSITPDHKLIKRAYNANNYAFSLEIMQINQSVEDLKQPKNKKVPFTKLHLLS